MQGEAMQHNWTDEAACRGRPQSWFFPPEGRGTAVAGWRVDVRPMALATCAICPVRAECLEDAHAHGEETGVWGGVDFGVASARLASRDRRTRNYVRARAVRMRAQGLSSVEIAHALGVARRTVFRYLEGSS